MKPSTRRLTLLLILVVAASLRFYGLNWDDGHHAHPDERWIAMVAPTITWPQRAADILAPRRSTLNPLWDPAGGSTGVGQVRNFAYGHLPLYLQAFSGRALASLGRVLRERTSASGRPDRALWQDLSREELARELIEDPAVAELALLVEKAADLKGYNAVDRAP